MPRSDSVSFVENLTEIDLKKAYCPKCEDEKSMSNQLVPRLDENGIADDKFKICSYCRKIYPIFDVKYFTEYQPKGFISDNPYDSGTKVTAMGEKRINKSNKKEGIEPIEIPKLAGKPDTELENMLSGKDRPVVLNYLNDDLLDDLAYY